MIIPITIPENGHMVNLNDVRRMEELDGGQIEVSWTNGESDIFEGKAAGIIKSELLFHFSQYQNFKRELHKASQIIQTPSSSTKPNLS